MNKRKITAGAAWLMAFALWTWAVCAVDVRPIGPEGSSVGLATMNGWFHRVTGVHMALYALTDWLSLIPVGFAAGFALLGLAQWIRRKKLKRVDISLLALGGFYMAVMAAYVVFETVVINRRPVLIEGVLEASYPSSTTMLVICVMETAVMQLRERLRRSTLRRCAVWLIRMFTALMISGRLLSGVHWLSDIIGGCLLSAGLIAFYAAASAENGGAV